MKRFAAAVLTALIVVSPAWGADQKFVKPSPKDKCPVCGMFAAKYSDFVTQVIFKDGSYAVFDGAKDMFKYYFNLKKYAPAKRAEDIDAIYVTDYYSLEPIDGLMAWYVVGSDIFGPMGKELVPFAKESDARGFMKDHKGKSLLRFKDVHVELIRELD
ncbi:MAG TPA: nitrous oxide reductase accessory protein NosL [Syntrophales bacterium]|nr:nitrous oxide reductase accessory protein NosL [Syntrophales bacterium]